MGLVVILQCKKSKPNLMKNLITLAAILLTTTAAMASTPQVEKVIEIAPVVKTEVIITTKAENTIARIYRSKNSRISKALKFASKKTAAKMA